MAYRDTVNRSTDNLTLYIYMFAIDNFRTVQSITLPNQPNVEIGRWICSPGEQVNRRKRATNHSREKGWSRFATTRRRCFSSRSEVKGNSPCLMISVGCGRSLLELGHFGI